MEKKELKETIHEIVEKMDDELGLQMVYETAVEYATQKDDNLSEEQWQELQTALEEVKQGRYSTHEEVMQRIKEWRTK
jgi:predicted transcriptional regulator